MMLWKCCTQYTSKFWKLSSGHKTGKGQFFHCSPKERQYQRMLKHTIALISHASQVMLRILQATFQQYMNHELPVVQTGFRKVWGTKDQSANIYWIIEKARKVQKITYFCLVDYAKATDCMDHNKLGKILKEMECQTTYLSPEKSVSKSRIKN